MCQLLRCLFAFMHIKASASLLSLVRKAVLKQNVLSSLALL